MIFHVRPEQKYEWQKIKHVIQVNKSFFSDKTFPLYPHKTNFSQKKMNRSIKNLSERDINRIQHFDWCQTFIEWMVSNVIGSTPLPIQI